MVAIELGGKGRFDVGASLSIGCDKQLQVFGKMRTEINFAHKERWKKTMVLTVVPTGNFQNTQEIIDARKRRWFRAC